MRFSTNSVEKISFDFFGIIPILSQLIFVAFLIFVRLFFSSEKVINMSRRPIFRIKMIKFLLLYFKLYILFYIVMGCLSVRCFCLTFCLSLCHFFKNGNAKAAFLKLEFCTKGSKRF